MLVLEFENRNAGRVRFEHNSLGAYVKFSFVPDLLFSSYRLYVPAEAREVPDIDLVLFKVVEGKAFGLVGGNPHNILNFYIVSHKYN